MLRQLEAILHISKLARAGQHVDALREIIKIPFLPLNPRVPDIHYDVFQKLSPHVQACVPHLLKITLNCLDNVKDTDGTLRALKSKVNILSVYIPFVKITDLNLLLVSYLKSNVVNDFYVMDPC